MWDAPAMRGLYGLQGLVMIQFVTQAVKGSSGRTVGMTQQTAEIPGML